MISHIYHGNGIYIILIIPHSSVFASGRYHLYITLERGITNTYSGAVWFGVILPVINPTLTLTASLCDTVQLPINRCTYDTTGQAIAYIQSGTVILTSGSALGQ